MKTLQELLALFNSAKSSLADLLKAMIDGENGDSRPLSEETQERISFAYLLRDDIEYLMAQDNPDLQQIFVKLNLMISFIGNITAATQVYSSYTSGSGIVFLPGIGGSERYATNSIYGIVRLSVAAVSPNAPIAVGDNDPRLIGGSQAYDDSIVGALINAAGQLVLTKRNASTITTSAGNILNQTSSAQVGGFWINGSGTIEGDLVLSNIQNTLTTNKFAVVDDQNIVKYITSEQLLSIIGIGALTASRAVVTNSLGAISTSLVTDTEIGYLTGANSPIQTQIDGKQPLDSDLTAIAALTANGLLRKTAGTWAMDTNTYLTANQTITLTGPITGSGSTTIATTIANNSIDLAKIVAINTSRLLGRSTASAGNVEELTIGSGLSLSAGALASTITQYTDAMARTSISETIVGIDYNSTTGVFSLTSGYVIPTTTEEISWNSAYDNMIISASFNTANGNFTLTQQDGGTIVQDLDGRYLIGNETITLSGDVTGVGTTAIATTIANDAVTFAKIQNVSSGILLGRSTAASGNIEEITIGTGLDLAAGILSLGTITASRAVVTNVIGGLEASTTTATQIGYLSTLSSNAQTQIDSKQPLDATLTALAAFGTATPGIMVLSGADTFVTRILEGTAGRITVNNASGSGTNPSIDIASTYAGQSTITTVGTITVGAWNGSSIASGYIVGASNWNEAYDEKINSFGFNTSTGIFTGTQQDGGTITASLDGRYLLSGGGTMTGYLTLNGDPVANLHAATKQYVDNIATGIKPKGSVSASTTGTLPSYTGATQTLTGTSNGAISAQDGVTLVLGDYLLVKNEAGANEKYNGIYEVTEVGDGANPYELTRISTANTWSEIVNATIYVAGGATLQGYTYYQTSPSGGTLGTTAITFVVFSISTVYLEGSGINITGNTISIASLGIVDSMVSASASITLSKLASVTANKALISDTSGYVSASLVTNTELGYVSGVTSALQTQLDNKQPLDATLTALAAFNSNGIMVQTAVDTFTSRTIIGTTNRLDVTNGSGVAGNPTLDISSAYVGQASITTLGMIAVGTWNGTAIGDTYISSASSWNTAYNNMIVSAAFNTSDGVLTLTQQDAGTVTVDLDGRYILGNEAITLSGEASGSGTTSISVTLANSAVIGKVLTGYVSGAGAVSATDTILQAIQKLNGNITALITGVSSVSGTTNRITSSGGSTPTIDIASTYVGQTSLTTLGTIAIGTWNGTSIADAYISSASNWNTAYTNRITSLTTTGSSGASTLVSNVLNIPTYTLAGLGGQPLATNLTSISGLTFVSTSFVKMTSAGTFALDTNTYVNTSAISGTSGTIPLFGASNSLGNSIITQSGGGLAIAQTGANYSAINTGTKTTIGLPSVTNVNLVFGVSGAGSLGSIIQSRDNVSAWYLSLNPFGGQIITANATDTGEHFIIGGSARVNGDTDIIGNTRLIGTTNSIYERVISTSGSFYFGIDSSTAGTFGNGNYSRVVYSGGAYPIDFWTNDIVRGRITSDGNWLLGTSIDNGLGNKLQVAGSGIFNGNQNGDFGLYNINTSSGTGAFASLYASNDGTGAGAVAVSVVGTGNTTGGLFVQDGGVIASGTGLSGGLSIATRTSASMRFYTDSTLALTLASNQAATFSSTITSGAIRINQAVSEIPFQINSSSSSNSAYTQYLIGNSGGWEVGMANSANGYAYQFFYGSFGTVTPILSIANTGAATFSSNVSANGLINTTAGNGISAGGNSFAITPSATRGVININGSTDQFLTFSTQSYIYNGTTFRILSTSDIDFVAGGVQRLLISSSTGATTFSSSVTSTSFINSGSSNSFFLLGGGGTVATSSYLTTAAAATGYIQNQIASAQVSSNFWISGDAKVNGKVYIGTNGAYFEEVLVGGLYKIQVTDSAGNVTIL